MRVAAAAVAAALAPPAAAAGSCKWRWAASGGPDAAEPPTQFRAYQVGQGVTAAGSFGAVQLGAPGKVVEVPRPGAGLDAGATARVRFGATTVDAQPGMIRPTGTPDELIHKQWEQRLPALHAEVTRRRGAHSLQFDAGKVPTQQRTCETEGQGWRDESYGLMSNIYDVGEPILGATLQQCIDICSRRYDVEWSPSERCYGFSRQRNIGDDEPGDCWMKSVILDLVGDWYSHDNWNTYVFRCSAKNRPCSWTIADDFSVAHVEQFADTRAVESPDECLDLCERLPECVSASYNKMATKCAFSRDKPDARIDTNEYVSYTCDRSGVNPDIDEAEELHPCDDVSMNACDHVSGMCVKRYHGSTLTRGYWCTCDDDANETTTYNYTCAKGCDAPYAGHTCVTWEQWNTSTYDSWQGSKAQEDYWREKRDAAQAVVTTLDGNLSAATQAVAAASASELAAAQAALEAVILQLATAQEALDATQLHFSTADALESEAKDVFRAANRAKEHKESGAAGPHRIFGVDAQMGRRMRVLSGATEWTRQCVPAAPAVHPARRQMRTLSHGAVAAATAGMPYYGNNNVGATRWATVVCAGTAAVVAAGVGGAALFAAYNGRSGYNPLRGDGGDGAAPIAAPEVARDEIDI